MRHHRPLRYISLFSGIEAASVAAEPLGWEPVCFCEIDPFPSAVLAHHYPNVPNLGDITKVDWKEVLRKYGSVDVVVGGSPCQSFSVAGKREGLAGASGLMFEYIRAISEIMPQYWVWENVPGALSSSGGADFECFLREMAGIRGSGGERYGIGWRVLDAQFFRVAQRRRRLFAVGVLGDLAGPCEILFESEGLLWNTPSSKQKSEALAADARCGAQGAGGGAVGFAQNTRDEVRIQGDGTISGALAAQPGMKQQTYVAECLNPWDVQSKRVFSEDACAPTLGSGTTEGMNIQPSVLQAVSFQTGHSTGNGSGFNVDDVSYTISTSNDQAVAEPIVMASAHTNAEIGEGGVTPTLIAHIAKDAPVLATAQTCSQPSTPFDDTTVIDRAAYNQGENAAYPPHIEQTDVMDTLVARGPHAVGYSCRTETM